MSYKYYLISKTTPCNNKIFQRQRDSIRNITTALEQMSRPCISKCLVRSTRTCYRCIFEDLIKPLELIEDGHVYTCHIHFKACSLISCCKFSFIWGHELLGQRFCTLNNDLEQRPCCLPPEKTTKLNTMGKEL